MSYPIGSYKGFIIVRKQGQLQVAFICSSLQYFLDFDEWQDQQLSSGNLATILSFYIAWAAIRFFPLFNSLYYRFLPWLSGR